MKGYDFSYFLREGVKSIFLHGFMSFAAVSVIVACLIIMGSFMLLTLNINIVIDKAEDSNEIIAFVDDSLAEADAQSVGSKINAVENVASSIFVTSSEAFNEYSKELGEDSYLLEGLDSQTLLRSRYRIFVENVGLTKQTAAAVEKIPGIAKVKASYEISEGIVSLRNVVNIVSYILAAVLLGISIFIIANTVKLTTFDRREEIAIMKMVGATNAFIRWPFVFEGFSLGITGGALAFLCQWGIYSYATGKITESMRMVTLLNFHTIAAPMLLVFVIVGFLIGVGGSVLTIRKFLRV